MNYIFWVFVKVQVFWKGHSNLKKCQKSWEIFFKFCGLLKISLLYNHDDIKTKTRFCWRICYFTYQNSLGTNFIWLIEEIKHHRLWLTSSFFFGSYSHFTLMVLIFHSHITFERPLRYGDYLWIKVRFFQKVIICQNSKQTDIFLPCNCKFEFRWLKIP